MSTGLSLYCLYVYCITNSLLLRATVTGKTVSFKIYSGSRDLANEAATRGVCLRVHAFRIVNCFCCCVAIVISLLLSCICFS